MAAETTEYAEQSDRIRKLWAQSHVPERHRMMSQAVTGLVELPEARAGWTEKLNSLSNRLDEGIMAVLHGPRGTGKTQLACCIIRNACLAEVPAYYTTAIGFFLHVRASYGGGPDTERAVVQAYLSPGVLVIDEVHERGNTPWEDRLLGHVIDQRYANLRTTILVTNETAEAAAKNLGSSITDRVKECGWWVACDWPSFRGGGS